MLWSISCYWFFLSLCLEVKVWRSYSGRWYCHWHYRDSRTIRPHPCLLLDSNCWAVRRHYSCGCRSRCIAVSGMFRCSIFCELNADEVSLGILLLACFPPRILYLGGSCDDHDLFLYREWHLHRDLRIPRTSSHPTRPSTRLFHG